MEPNPYSAPATSPYGATNLGGAAAVSAAALQQLAATKPWVRFISVITFIGAGFLLIGALAMVAMGSMGALSKSGGAAFTGAMGFGIAALYAVLSIIYIFPGVKLWKYASSIARLMQSGRDEDLVAALNQQRSFWKFVGILMILFIAIYLIVIVVALIMGGVAAASLR